MNIKSWIKKKISFSSGDKETITPSPTLTQPELSLHTSCKTLPFSKFKPAYCRNDYSGLVIKGEPTPEELQAAWNEILFDYASLIKTENSDYLFILRKDISDLQWQIWYVDECCREESPEFEIPAGVLHIRYEEALVKELKKIGYTIKDEFGTDEYFDRLSLIVSLCKSRVHDLEELRAEYDRLQKTFDGKQQTEEELDATQALLSKYQGYNIDDETTTVYRFTIIFNNYLADMKARKKLLENAGGR